MTVSRSFLLLWGHAAARAFLGRRGLGLLLLALLPAGFAWLQVEHDAETSVASFLATMLVPVFQFVVPFAGLFLGVAVLGDEVDGRTLTYLFTRPLPRPAVFLARYLGLATAFGLLLFGAVALAGAVYAGRVPLAPRDAIASAGIAVLGFLVYAALFAALRTVVQRALFVGFMLGFILEGFVSKLPASGISPVSVWHHLALLETRLLGATPRGELEDLLQGIAADETVPGSLAALAVVLVASLAAGAWLVHARETRLANAAG